jgi:AraC-like DNA-binding protein
MLLDVFDSACLPVKDRAEAWTDVTSKALVPTEIRVRDPETARLRLQHLPLGAAALSSLAYGSLLSRRSPRLIRRSDPEILQLAVITGGRQSVEQARNTVSLAVGDMVLYDSSQPFDACADTAADGASSLILQFPRTLLPFRADQLQRLLAVPLDARSGTGRLLAQFLKGLMAERDAYSPADQARLADVAVDLTIAVLGHYLDDDRATAFGSRPHALFLDVSTFIDTHLAEPLAPQQIADATDISVRYLQRIFQEHGTTVMDFVRERRINHCRRDLADPALDHVPVHAIGARWGFPQPSDFSRSFRRATGVPPGRYRSLARQNPSARQKQHVPRGRGPGRP